MKKKLKIAVVILISVMFALFLLFNDEFHNNTLERTEPDNLTSTDYIKLESGEEVEQVISINRNTGYLKDIEVILINLSEETNGDILNVKILKDGKAVKEVNFSIKEAQAGEWVSIPIGKTLYPGREYEIEFSIQDNNGSEVPYLVTQEVEEASPYHIQLLLNGESLDKSVAISYNFYDVVPFAIRLVASILCLIIAGGIIYFIFRENDTVENSQKILRDVNCDLMRVICMVFVIAIHAERAFIKSTFVEVVFSTLFFTCNGMFYMLSGRFNLQKEFLSKEDYKRYFSNRAVTILFPYILVTILLSLWDMLDNGTWDGVVSFIRGTYISLMNTNALIHLWFMYPLIGMLLGVPFMAKMLRSMSEWELNILFGIGIAWNIVEIYLTLDMGVGFSYSGWMLSEWMMLFFVGYYCSRIINNSNKKYLYLFGLLGFAITVLGKYFIPDRYYNSTDLAVAYIVFTMAFYIFLDREISIKNEYVKKAICFVAKYSFLIYMLHWNVLYKITPKIVTVQATLHNWLMRIFTTLIISLLLSIILDSLIISPVQRILRRKSAN